MGDLSLVSHLSCLDLLCLYLVWPAQLPDEQQLQLPLHPPEHPEHPPPFNSLFICLRALLPLKNITTASTSMTIPFPTIVAIWRLLAFGQKSFWLPAIKLSS